MKPEMVSEMEWRPNETKEIIKKTANDSTPAANDCKWKQTESKPEICNRIINQNQNGIEIV